MDSKSVRFSREEGQLIIDKSFQDFNLQKSSDDQQQYQFLAFDQEYYLVPVRDASQFSGIAMNVFYCISDACILVTTSIVLFDRKESSEFDEEHCQRLHDLGDYDDEDEERQRRLPLVSRNTREDMEEVWRVRLLDQQAACLGHKVGMTAAKSLLTSLRGNGDIG